ncbi:MAG: sulfatase-like hydrolase/transferase [Pseudomonadota bacterium]
MKPKNLLIIMSDEHSFETSGCYGHPIVKSPNIDALAARGVRFTNAYTPSPICVPTRAAIQTGRHVHEIGTWDSATPYNGSPPSWGHELVVQGRRSVSIGKLHFRSKEDDNGFDPEICPMHVVNGLGWIQGLLRDELPDNSADAREYAEMIGPGGSSYVEYDRRVCAEACNWLEYEAGREDTPWTAFVSMVAPHYPLTPPDEFGALYDPAEMDEPRDPGACDRHPYLREFKKFWNYEDYFTPESRAVARASYYGLISYLDDNVGKILKALDASGQADETVVIYTSDHGDMIGNHGLWAKCTMYEDSAGVPLIMAGPGIAEGEVAEDVCTLLDLHPTVMEVAGIEPKLDAAPRAGVSLFYVAAGKAPGRTILSEYHDGGSTSGFYMARWDKWKYVDYLDYPPQLFDLQADPLELDDLGESPAHAHVLAEGRERLEAILDPEATNARALAEQAARVAQHGGREKLLAHGTFGYTPIEGST